MILEDRRFYVYIYCDPRKSGNFEYIGYKFNFEPFYVGKGLGKRCFKHLYISLASDRDYKSNKIFHIMKVLKRIPEIIFVKKFLTETEAWNLEEKLIKSIGRLSVNTGPLTNIAVGGNGFSSTLNPAKEIVVAKKISDSHLKRIKDGTHNLLKQNHWFNKEKNKDKKQKFFEKQKIINLQKVEDRTHLFVVDNPSKYRGEEISPFITKRNKTEIELGIHVFQIKNPMKDDNSNHPNKIKQRNLLNFLKSLSSSIVLDLNSFRKFNYVKMRPFHKTIQNLIIENELNLDLKLTKLTSFDRSKVVKSELIYLN